MFNYDVMCVVCASLKVYSVSFRDALTETDLQTRKSGGVCPNCVGLYHDSIKNKTKLDTNPGPFFILKA